MTIVTMRMVFAGLFVVTFTLQVPDPAADRLRTARDADVVLAIQRDLLIPYAREFLAVTDFTLVMAEQTLAICSPEPTAGCISQFDANGARSEAIKGMWSLSLARAFAEENRVSRRIGPVPGVHVGVAPPDVRKALPLGISAPVYHEKEALVLVQFARQIGWLVSLVDSAGVWRVNKKVVVSER
jgi:hypothetical protein